MTTELCRRLDLEVPVFAFTRSPEVVVEVSRAGGMGVLGVIATDAHQLSEKLAWIDAHVGGRPWGVDVVMPASHVGSGGGGGMGDAAALEAMLPEPHRAFVNALLEEHGVPPLPEGVRTHEALKGWTDAVSRKQVDMCLEYPVRLVANALGPPPPEVIADAHAQGVQVAALVGSVRHARKQVEAGVDIVVAQGTEAGGHTGEVSTFVLVPGVVSAVGDVPVLAAGGVGSGQQIAAALAMGAQGVWTGSIWLTAAESDVIAPIQQKLLRAGYRDTVRSRAISGKPARQLRTAWSEAWDAGETPAPLPMPLQFMLTAEAVARIYRHATDTGEDNPLLTSPVGQIVGRMAEIEPTAAIMARLRGELAEALARLRTL